MHQAFIDGSTNHPGCNCGLDCSFPCWQRAGMATACEACNCPSFPWHAGQDPTDRADELRAMSDLWPEIDMAIPGAIADLLANMAEHVTSLDHAALEAKFRKGEAEHDRDWLDMTRDQIANEVRAEWLDLVLYHAMLRARFAGKETAPEART